MVGKMQPRRTTMASGQIAPDATPTPPVDTSPAAPVVDLSSVKLLDLDLIKDQWHHMTVAEKAAQIEAKLNIGPADQIKLISMIDRNNPRPRVIEYRDRTVCIAFDSSPNVSTAPPATSTAPATPTAPAGQVVGANAGPSATPGSMSILAWATFALITGGLLYATVNLDPNGKRGRR